MDGAGEFSHLCPPQSDVPFAANISIWKEQVCTFVVLFLQDQCVDCAFANRRPS